MEFQATFTMLDQVLANQANLEVAFPSQAPTLATRVYDFMRMNLLEYHGSKVEDNPVEFNNEAYRNVSIMVVPLQEKDEFVDINLKVWPRFGITNGLRKEVMKLAE